MGDHRKVIVDEAVAIDLYTGYGGMFEFDTSVKVKVSGMNEYQEKLFREAREKQLSYEMELWHLKNKWYVKLFTGSFIKHWLHKYRVWKVYRK
jgi:hypothetical protein